MRKLLITIGLFFLWNTLKSQCQYKTDTLKCWMVVLTKVSNYKTVKIVQCKEIQEFDENCLGWIKGYLNLLNQPLVTTGFYIVHISNTKISL